MLRASFIRFAACLALAACVLPSLAGSLGVNPIRVGLSATRPTAAITLSNTGNAPMVVQMQVAKWTAAAGEDVYEPSTDILVAPPIVSIAPGASQIVRVGLGSDPGSDRELAYRLFIEEVPPPPKAGYQGLQVALRLGLPVFVEPGLAVRPKFEWSATLSAANEITVKMSNVGDAHAQILNVKLSTPGESLPIASNMTSGYLLPGQTRQLSLGLGKPWRGRQLHVSATTDRGVTEAELELQVP